MRFSKIKNELKIPLKKKIKITILSMAILILMMQGASGIKVGESANFNSNAIDGTIMGNSTGVTQNDSNGSNGGVNMPSLNVSNNMVKIEYKTSLVKNTIDSTNENSLQGIADLLKEYTNRLDKSSVTEYFKNNNSAVINQPINIKASELSSIAGSPFYSGGLNSGYYNIIKPVISNTTIPSTECQSIEYSHDTNGKIPYIKRENVFHPGTQGAIDTSKTDMTKAIYKSLDETAGYNGYSDCYKWSPNTQKVNLLDKSLLTDAQKALLMDDKALQDFINTLKNDYTGSVVRPNFLNTTDLIDFDTYAHRMEALRHYLNSYAADDYVNTQYITEVRLSSVTNNVLVGTQVLNWAGTPETHFWEFECIESPDGEYHKGLQKFGGPTITQQFYYPGKYHVTATQVIQEKYCNVVSFEVNQYWVVSETGQIIWQRHDVGENIPSDNSGNYSSIYDIPDFSSDYSGLKTEGPYYVTVYDDYITVTEDGYNYGSGGMSGGMTRTIGLAGIWGNNDYTTKRIE